MPQFRTIAVLLALSALLCAGWTRTTHWHFHGHSSGQVTNAVGTCCSAAAEAGECHSGAEGLCVSGDCPSVEADHSHFGEHCSVCDFLASHVYGLVMIYGYAGMLAESQLLPEPLIDSPTSQERWVTCRGPPLAA
jgi:hypothetical protein